MLEDPRAKATHRSGDVHGGIGGNGGRHGQHDGKGVRQAVQGPFGHPAQHGGWGWLRLASNGVVAIIVPAPIPATVAITATKWHATIMVPWLCVWHRGEIDSFEVSKRSRVRSFCVTGRRSRCRLPRAAWTSMRTLAGERTRKEPRWRKWLTPWSACCERRNH